MSPSDWAASEKTPAWLFAAASMLAHWDRNQSLMISGKDYADAIKRAAEIGVK